MATFANMKSYWSAGSLIFKSLITNNILLAFNATTGIVNIPSLTFGSYNNASALPTTRKIVKVPIAGGNANAIAFAWQNPETSQIVVERVAVNVTTAGATATSVMDIGVVSAATSTADTLINGLPVTATGLFDNISDAGVAGKSRALMDANGGTNQYITGKILTANAAALGGNVYIEYFTV